MYPFYCSFASTFVVDSHSLYRTVTVSMHTIVVDCIFLTKLTSYYLCLDTLFFVW